MLRSLVVAMLLVVAACSTSPLGRRQLILLPDSKMDQMGLTTYQAYKQEVPPSQKTTVNRYVDCVAQAVIVEARQGAVPQSWEVTVFEDDEPNAFAVPGGKIGVNTGLLKVAENQDQLAAVLAHEVSHVLARHSNERASTGLLAQTAVAAGSAAGVDPSLVGLFGMGAQYGVILPYSRTHESEADLHGLDMMAQAGFDPRQSVLLWQNMSKAGGDRPPDLLSTHPGPETRMADLNARMPAAMKLYEQAAALGKKPKCK